VYGKRENIPERSTSLTDKNNPDQGYGTAARLSFPDDEAKFPWLSMLLGIYHVIDEGIAARIHEEINKGRRVACTRGCSSCCTSHRTIPVFPLELVGITWFAVEKLTGPWRDVLKRQLANHEENDDRCPFLIEGACSIHPMRPIACRLFITLDTPCAETEDPFHTRKQDVLDPDRDSLDHAYFRMLPFHGIENEEERMEIVRSGAIRKLVTVLQRSNWKSLAERMDAFDQSDHK